MTAYRQWFQAHVVESARRYCDALNGTQRWWYTRDGGQVRWKGFTKCAHTIVLPKLAADNPLTPSPMSLYSDLFSTISLQTPINKF